MAHRPITATLLSNELTFTASRSGGAGGQNVNKVNTKVTLKFNVVQSKALTPEEKDMILSRLRSKLTDDGVLILSAQEKRSQMQNREEAILKFEKLMTKAFEVKKPRKATKPSKASVQQRIKKKKQHSDKKKWRQKPVD